MIKKIIILIFILSCIHISYAQISFTSTTTPSTCSANGSIAVNVTGGEAPYLYQIISSTTGVIRPAQSVPLFQNLPSGTYTIRVTDKNNLTAVNQATILGNYVPLSFSSTQQQSTIIIQPLNGKRPYTFSYSIDGVTFSTPKDSNSFKCLDAGSYLFRVYDSCSNFYTETVVVAPVVIDAVFSCVANSSNSTKSIVLNSLVNGNGGFVFHAFGVNYDQTNTTGNFSNINRCNKDISISVTDRCNVRNAYLVCPTPGYTFDVTCINFKDHKITIGNVMSGSGLPYQYIANDVASTNTTIQNFPIPGDSILAGLMDSCGFKNTVEVRRMNVFYNNQTSCENGSLKIHSSYRIDNRAYSFPPTKYTSVSGPSSFNVTDNTNRDTSVVSISDLETGKYIYKITNGCGDEVLDSFTYTKRCFKKITVFKGQSCSTLNIYLEKDCYIDTNTVYTLMDLQGHVIAQNTTGGFTGMNNDSCYKVKMHELDCDTTITDYINPLRPKLKLFQNSCDELSFSVRAFIKKNCSPISSGTHIEGVRDFVLTDSLFNILRIDSTGFVSPVPPNTYWIYARTIDCNSDTLRYTKRSGFVDSISYCITPVVRVGNNNVCKISWNIRLINNITNINFYLVGNGINVQGVRNFYGIDSGRYILRDGCKEQELFLPNYYNFKAVVNPGCPSNASVTASYIVDTNYINRLSDKYLFTVCDAPPIDYNIKEVGTNAPLVYSTNGYFNNLKTGTFYAVFFKGNDECNFFADTIFTPFYSRPALKATYGLICNGNNATVKASVVGGTPPYTYEVLNTSIPPVVTDSNYVLYNSLALGTAQFRVNDACGISTDYSTEVLSVNFQPTFKKKCNGQVQLIAPDIFNTTYAWTNKNHDTIGTTAIVYTIPDGNDTFTVNIKHLTCSISKTLYVSDFSASIVNSNAGFDFAVDTTTTLLHGNIPPLNATGTWKQIDPSSGNTIFNDINDHQTKITVDAFPGQYTYVWTLTDTSIGCISEDTVVVSFLRCPNIRPVLYIKTIKNATCTNNGQISYTVTQASTPVHFLWNTGDTTSILKNLKDTMYIVTISDETSCTPDIIDTTIITGTKPTFKNVNDSFCNGDSVIFNNKKYFTAGDYADTLVNNAGCDSILSIHFFIFSKNDLYDSVRLCNNEKYALPDGRIISQSGDYIMKLKNANGCDSSLHYNIVFLPTQQLVIDTFICSGFNYQLPGGNIVQETGIYVDTLSNIFGCDSIIKTNLSVKDSLRNLFLGNDSAICEFDNLLLQLNFPGDVHYQWQDNSTNNNFLVQRDGIYYVKIYDGCTSLSDTIHVKTKDCSCTFYMPTAFSPNNDGVNDIFKPFAKCEYFKDYTLIVYNRWGELVFETNDISIGWNGTYKELEQQMDSYMWILKYADVLSNENVSKKGMLILLK